MFVLSSSLGILALTVTMWIWFAISMSNLAQVTVTLVDARGLHVDDETTPPPPSPSPAPAAVEFDVAIGLLHLGRHEALAYDGGDVSISYAGLHLADGTVPKFYVAGGPRRVEATRAVASAGTDQAPLSQMFREHLWVDQQLDGEAVFDVALSFYYVNVTTGDVTWENHYCKVGLPLHGKAAKPTNCGQPQQILHRR